MTHLKNGEGNTASGTCDINFTGSSPAMEAEGAVVLWKKSIVLHNIRYKWMGQMVTARPSMR